MKDFFKKAAQATLLIGGLMLATTAANAFSFLGIKIGKEKTEQKTTSRIQYSDDASLSDVTTTDKDGNVVSETMRQIGKSGEDYTQVMAVRNADGVMTVTTTKGGPQVAGANRERPVTVQTMDVSAWEGFKNNAYSAFGQGSKTFNTASMAPTPGK